MIKVHSTCWNFVTERKKAKCKTGCEKKCNDLCPNLWFSYISLPEKNPAEVRLHLSLLYVLQHFLTLKVK